MAKGLFTQSACLLLTSVPGKVELEQALPGLAVAGEDAQSWWLPAEQLGANGKLLVQILPRPWSDDIDDPAVLEAWCTGLLGPLTYPGALERAARHAAVTLDHGAVLQIQSSYVLGAEDEAPVLPPYYQPRAELELVQATLRSLAVLPQACAYFNPNGEVLHSVAGWLALAGLPLWVGVHSFRTDRSLIMTTVGMEQFDLPDQQAEVDPAQIDPEALQGFLYQLAGQQLDQGEVMTSRGLGRHWRARLDESVGPRPRTVFSWQPDPRKKWFGW